MKAILAISLVIIALASCNAPIPITGNPDKLTSNSGTAGSSRMTQEMPGKPGTAGVITDTGKIGGPLKIDTLHVKRDSVGH